MARPGAEMKMNFFPAHPEAVKLIATHLELDEKYPDRVSILDPCAGEGDAVMSLAADLGVKPDHVYMVELNHVRAAVIAERHPGANLVGPASYTGVDMSPRCVGLCYCNPPYSDEMGGGGREEEVFVRQATVHLAPKGVLCAVVPLATIQNGDFVDRVDCSFTNVRVYKFPEQWRPHNECVVFGVKRDAEIPTSAAHEHGDLAKAGWHYGWCFKMETLTVLGQPYSRAYYNRTNGRMVADDPEMEVATYTLPWNHRPRVFRKRNLTEREKKQAFLGSPLNDLFLGSKAPKAERPPMSLAKGHVALCLASGMLDGVVEDGDSAHVVRGTSRKETYVASKVVTENEATGEVKEVVVHAQKIVMTIRAVDESGVIRTFTDRDEAAVAAQDDPSKTDGTDCEDTELSGGVCGQIE